MLLGIARRLAGPVAPSAASAAFRTSCADRASLGGSVPLVSDEAGGSAHAATHMVTVHARVTAWDRWSRRSLVALVPLAGAAVLQLAVEYRAGIPAAVWLLGVVMLLLGLWREAVA